MLDLCQVSAFFCLTLVSGQCWYGRQADFDVTISETPQEFSHFNWGHDIVRSSVDLVKEVDPEFELPGDFFQGNPYMPPARPQKGEDGSRSGH